VWRESPGDAVMERRERRSGRREVVSQRGDRGIVSGTGRRHGATRLLVSDIGDWFSMLATTPYSRRTGFTEAVFPGLPVRAS
jgi:hypothetical protein